MKKPLQTELHLLAISGLSEKELDMGSVRESSSFAAVKYSCHCYLIGAQIIKKIEPLQHQLRYVIAMSL
jgi:hypothetical protein